MTNAGDSLFVAGVVVVVCLTQMEQHKFGIPNFQSNG